VLHRGEVCGPMDVQMSYSHNIDDVPLVVFMGARCQNLTYVYCLDTTCATHNATVLGTDLQVGLGRTVALHDCSSTLSQLH
jgi:hypothetical protein